MTLDLPDRAEQERREDCVILEALAAQVKTFGADEGGVNPRQLFAAALAHCWGEEEEALQVIALHLATTRDEVVKLIKEGEVDQLDDSVVIELTINFPGLNLPRLNYVLAISTSWLLLVQCLNSPCNHPPGHTSQLLVEYDRDAEFGFSISPLFDIVSAALPSVTMPILSNLLRTAHIFFWPLAKVNLANLRMEPALSLSAGNKPETSTADVVRLEKTGRRKMRGGKVGSLLILLILTCNNRWGWLWAALASAWLVFTRPPYSGEVTCRRGNASWWWTRSPPLRPGVLTRQAQIVCSTIAHCQRGQAL